MKLYSWNMAKSTWTTFVLYVHIVIPCLLVRAVTYLKFIVWRNIRLFSWRDKIWFFSIVVRGIWFAFCFTLNTFTSKTSNLQLPFQAEGGKGCESWYAITKCQKKKYQQDFYFICIASHFFTGERFAMVISDRFFFHLRDKKGDCLLL